MPAVPVLISENPTESGVISLTLHPGVAFGTGFSFFFPFFFLTASAFIALTLHAGVAFGAGLSSFFLLFFF